MIFVDTLLDVLLKTFRTLKFTHAIDAITVTMDVRSSTMVNDIAICLAHGVRTP